MIFHAKNAALLDAALDAGADSHIAAHGALTRTEVTLAGTRVKLARSQDGAVRQGRGSASEPCDSDKARRDLPSPPTA